MAPGPEVRLFLTNTATFMAWPLPAAEPDASGPVAASYSSWNLMPPAIGSSGFFTHSLAERMDSADLQEGCCSGMPDIFSVWPRAAGQTTKVWLSSLYLRQLENGNSKLFMHS